MTIQKKFTGEKKQNHVHDENCSHGHSHEKQEPILRETPKIGRNDICSCGSKKKFKKCCAK